MRNCHSDATIFAYGLTSGNLCACFKWLITSELQPTALLWRTSRTQVERHDMISAYYRRLTGDDESVRLECARRWSSWEMAMSRLRVDASMLKRAESDVWALHAARRMERYDSFAF